MADVNQTPEWLIAGATIAAAVGTIAAVLIALYRETWREWRARPRLALELDPYFSVANLDLVWEQGPTPAHWARLRVANERGRRSAEDVEVLITRFRALGGEEEEWQPTLDTRALAWSNLRESDGAAVTKVQIPPGVSRHVDLLCVPAPKISDGAGGSTPADPKNAVRTTGHLCVVPDPADVSVLLFERHRYRIELMIAARDVDCSAYTLEFEFDGAYRDAEDFWSRAFLTPPRPA